MANSLDPDQARHFIRPDLGPNCLQRLSADDTRSQKVKTEISLSDSIFLQLSPALRNRFTEIWCPPSNQRQDLIDIIEHNLNFGIHLSNQEDGTSGVGRAIMEFVDWFTNNELGKR